MCANSASRLCECCAPSRTPPPETMRSTSGMRRRAAHHEAQLRGLVDDLVERDAGEVGELELDDRAQAGQRGADAAADEAALGQRRVADPLGAVPLVEALGRAEEPADAADVLAHHDHVGVGGELQVERLADRGHEAERCGRPAGRPGCGRCGAKTDGSRSSALACSSASAVLDRRLDLGVDVGADRGDALVVELAGARGAPLEPRQRILRLPLLEHGRVADVGQVRAHRVLHAAEGLHLEEASARRRRARARAPAPTASSTASTSLPSTTSPGIP